MGVTVKNIQDVLAQKVKQRDEIQKQIFALERVLPLLEEREELKVPDPAVVTMP